MRNQVVFGAFGGANIGDEAILYAVRKLLRRKNIAVTTVIGTGIEKADHNKNEFDRYTDGQIEFIPAANIRSSLKCCFGSDLLIGGGQLIDGSAGSKLAIFQLLLATISKLSGCRVRIVSVGVFRLESTMTRFLYSILFMLSDYISLRDQASINQVSYSYFARKKAKLVADVVFSLLPTKNVSRSETRNRIVVSVHNAPHVSFMDLDQAIGVVLKLIKAVGEQFEVVLTAHDRREKFDVAFANQILQRVNDTRLKLMTFSSVDECLEFYQDTHLVISSRMHPLIIGAVSGCHVVPLKGSSKVAEFANLVQVNCWDLNDLIELEEREFNKLVGIESDVSRPSGRVLKNLAELANKALGN